ncbi:MAG: aspartate-semialdehyde dehydrogenase [Flavobacteriaceae bacterium]|nr:aspartate-semialdehyde dehydrogenase [Flavobacteriaceae bacterium]
MKIALIGATGMVGKVMMNLIQERKIKYQKLILVASDKSRGKKILLNEKFFTIISIENCVKLKPDYAIFSAGSEVSLEWAPRFAEVGSTVIDNSSAWRMDPKKKLIIPEINGNVLYSDDKIIANPNCSTIQMLMVLAPIHKKYEIKRVIVSTYQSVTGTGLKGLNQLKNEENNIVGEMAYKHPIHRNAIPHCDDFMENGYTKEEIKLSNETKKILDPKIKVSATAVRVPIVGGHSESVNITLKRGFKISEIKKLLNISPGVIVKDDPENFSYPMPIDAENTDSVYVGRIREDFSEKNSLNLWIVSDNLRKGAATNAIQIMEYLEKKGI